MGRAHRAPMAVRRVGEVRAFVGIGSNLSNPIQQVSAAFRALARIPDTRLVGRSSLYQTLPMGPPDQPDFVNAVAALDTRLAPQTLLRELKAIEYRRGRRPSSIRWGPRILDLDLLLYGHEQRHEDGLTLPHPGLHERVFVMCPLHELAPDLVVPGRGPLASLMQSVPPCDVMIIQPDRPER